VPSLDPDSHLIESSHVGVPCFANTVGVAAFVTQISGNGSSA
jgi:hypothetical protein